MPVNKRHQAPQGSFSPLLLLPNEDKPSAKELLDSEQKRTDGRTRTEIRSLYLNLGINPCSAGSAYMEMGHTKILCTIYGPKELPKKEDITEEGQITCDFKFAPFSCTQRRQFQKDQQEMMYSKVIRQALQRVINMKSFPRLQLEMDIIVLENGGSALAIAITCASVALTEAGVEMLDLPIACSVSEHSSGFLVDPSIEEEFKASQFLAHPSISGSVMIAYLPSLGEVTAMKQLGHMTPDKLTHATGICVEGCMRVHQRVKAFLKEHLIKTTAEHSRRDTIL